ncbi:inter-alpha-trypsin inhibitor heavy chain H3-like isoform X3 [Cheilinus undulatus]|uniref:inter-alpha-trypsin inhibitor heavy chain H3-like isoform X3 n=1 Tax=Cheilinus undulatus TaxID=241271 RepID=UPI001BD674DF|nr:inter-alpha-trypsin inhibitor heavy chain H3-like isoform X3 [Cheilinus undulatus]
MARAVVQLVLFGLLSALVTTLADKDDWDIYSFHINSTVSSRYATTVIKSRVANRMNESKEIEFHVRIPKNAFISKFRMFIDGQPYDGVVKAKEAAKQQYTDAVSRGQSAGIVSSVGRTLEEFKTSVNVAAHKKVTFELTYEELLKRKLGKYELQIHARPMQPVKDFKVDVHINEDAGINFLEVTGGLSTNAMANAITKTLADKQAWLYFYPTEDQQKSCDSCGEQGMNGDLVIVYDVNRDASFGDIKKSSGYFVHHFAPSNLARIPKNVIFVIDQSGSMRGRKIQQTQIALIHILNDLAEDDFFGLITFDGSIFHWKRELVQANEQNVASAKTFAQNIQSRGATNINQAVLDGTSMLNEHPREGSASILILLTDGDPTSGVTNLEVIQSNVREAINGKFPLYCLGFGFDVKFEFLEKMSLQNNGVARRIYEDSDADLQLKGFYDEVATPLLTDVTMIYEGGVNVTQTNFSQYYNGSEIVVAGQITDNDIETFTPQVIAISRNTRVVFTETNPSVESTGTVSDSNIQRVWAYLTVKQLLEKELQLSGPEKESAKKEALELSLKYSFVTPLTSMVVTKPPGESADVLHKPKEGETQPVTHTQSQHHRGSAMPFGADSSRSTLRRGIVFSASPVRYSRRRPARPPPPVPNPVVHATQFLHKTENQTLPLCYNVVGNINLKLLHHPNGGLLVNGELDASLGGFRRIAIHTASAKFELEGLRIVVRDPQGRATYLQEDEVITRDNVTVIRRPKEIDFVSGDTRIVLLIHEKSGLRFLWPVIRQQSTDGNLTGILALNPAAYEVMQQIPPYTNLKIQNNEMQAVRSTVADYSIPSAPMLDCWLVTSEFALQRSMGEFIVAQI